jgi:hypothetical protein
MKLMLNGNTINRRTVRFISAEHLNTNILTKLLMHIHIHTEISTEFLCREEGLHQFVVPCEVASCSEIVHESLILHSPWYRYHQE